jgi:hypothetical protein
MVEGSGAGKVFWGNLRERSHLEDLGMDERLILKWIFKQWDGTWTGLISFRLEAAVSYEYRNEAPRSVNGGEFFD